MASDAYLAGLFDGEGSVSLRVAEYPGHTAATSIGIAVGMIVEAPLRLLESRFGGRCYRDKRLTKAGNPVYRWEVTGTTAKHAVLTLLPLCIIKKPQLALALETIGLIELSKARIRGKGKGRPKPLPPLEKELRTFLADECRALNIKS